jgi:hypothetical protein
VRFAAFFCFRHLLCRPRRTRDERYNMTMVHLQPTTIGPLMSTNVPTVPTVRRILVFRRGVPARTGAAPVLSLLAWLLSSWLVLLPCWVAVGTAAAPRPWPSSPRNTPRRARCGGDTIPVGPRWQRRRHQAAGASPCGAFRWARHRHHRCRLGQVGARATWPWPRGSPPESWSRPGR